MDPITKTTPTINVSLLKYVFDAQNDNIKELELENKLLIKTLILLKDK